MLTFIKSVVWPFIKDNKYIIMAIISGLLLIRRYYKRYKQHQEKLEREKKEFLEKSKVHPKSDPKPEPPRINQRLEDISTKKLESPKFGARKISEIVFKNDPKTRMEELPEVSSSSENLTDEKSTNSTLERVESDNLVSVRSKKRLSRPESVKSMTSDVQVIENQIVPMRTAVKVTLSTVFGMLMLLIFMAIGVTTKMNALESMIMAVRSVGSN